MHYTHEHHRASTDEFMLRHNENWTPTNTRGGVEADLKSAQSGFESQWGH